MLVDKESALSSESGAFSSERTGWKSFQIGGTREAVHPGKAPYPEKRTQEEAVPRQGVHSGRALYPGKVSHQESHRT